MLADKITRLFFLIVVVGYCLISITEGKIPLVKATENPNQETVAVDSIERVDTLVDKPSTDSVDSTSIVALAQPPEYQRGYVEQVLQQVTFPTDPPGFSQTLRVRLADGKQVEITTGAEYQPLNADQLLKVGEQIIVSYEQTGDGGRWVLADINRLPAVFAMVGLFVFVVILVARWQGFFSVIGMSISLAILLLYTAPSILEGKDPFAISIVTGTVIAIITLYIAHGISLKSHIAMISTLITLGLVALLATVAVQTSRLMGLGSEEAYFLRYGQTAIINLRGLLLGGIILGALGVLDDITISQSAVVMQLARTNKKLSAKALFLKGMEIGRDHIASLVNTLFLAYVGANMALFLLFYTNEQTPFWVALNSELIVEEIIRTTTGSLGLVLAVPLTSFLAALAVKHWPQRVQQTEIEHHHHE